MVVDSFNVLLPGDGEADLFTINDPARKITFREFFHDEFSAGVESVFLVTDQGTRLLSRVPAEVFIC